MAGGTSGDEPVRSAGKRRILISGRFFPQGAGAIVNANNMGKAGWTVARTGVGLYLLTLDRRWLKLLLNGLQLQLAAPAVRQILWGVQTNTATAITIVIAVIDGAGAAQDIAADPNNSITFELEAVQDTVIG